jgi:hypothetical protein
MSNKPKKRILDGRYKSGVDSGTMSHLSTILPLRSYSVLKPDPNSATEKERRKIEMIREGKRKKREEKLLKQKLNKK